MYDLTIYDLRLKNERELEENVRAYIG